MPQIGRPPNGFLDLVAAETGGKTPSQYLDDLRATVDLTDLYLQQTLTAYDGTLAHTAPGDTFTLTVTAGETWLLRTASIAVTLPFASSRERWELQVSDLPREWPPGALGFSNFVPWVSRLLVAQGAGEFGVDAIVFPSILALPGGTELRWRVLERDGGAIRSTVLKLGINRLSPKA